MQNISEIELNIDKADFKKKLDIKDGEKGEIGPQGDRGETGPQGISGEKGTDGSPDNREQIVEKINTGGEKDTKIEAKQISGLPNFTREIVREVGGNVYGAITETPLKDATTGALLAKDSSGAWLVSSGGGGGTPGGSDTQVQFNDGGVFGGDTALTWDKVNGQLNIGIGTSTATGNAQFPLNIVGTINDYLAMEIQNLSSGDSASTDISIGADNDGTGLLGHYTDVGIFGSGFLSTAIGNVKTVSVSAGGTGYTVGDILTLISGDSNATVTVATLTGSVVATVTLTDNGTGYVLGSSIATTGGTGTGATINILTLIDNSIYSANDGYLYTSGGNMIIGTDEGVAGKIIKFHTGGTAIANTRMIITEVGVAIGTNAPTTRFQVIQGTTATGTVSNTAGGTTVTGVGTQFLNTFKSGDSITIGSDTVTITIVTSDTVMTTLAITNAHSGATYTLTGGTLLSVFGNGKIGMGTITPDSALQIVGVKPSDTTAVIGLSAINGLKVVGGIGGISTRTVSNTIGGTGGGVSLTGGLGGTDSVASALRHTGGPGGGVVLSGGGGGTPTFSSVPDNRGGVGGQVNLNGGFGGNSTGTVGTGGAGGAVQVLGGNGGTSNSFTGGVGGNALFTGGTGGASTSGNAGAGGVIGFNGGQGGISTSAIGGNGGGITFAGGPSRDGSAIGGNGGDLIFRPGNGGTATAGAGGNGGKVYLYGGFPANGTTTNGVIGNIILGVTEGGTLQLNKIGIGTSAPDQTVEINLGTAGGLRLTYNDQNGSAATYMDTTLSSVGETLFTGAGSAPTFQFANNVGIGTTPSTKLHVLSTTEQLRLGYDAAKYVSFTVESGGDLAIATARGQLIMQGTTTAGPIIDYDVNSSSTTTLTAIRLGNGTIPSGAASGIYTNVAMTPTINTSGTHGWNMLFINPQITAEGSGAKYLIQAQKANADKFTVSDVGVLTAASTIVAGATVRLKGYTVATLPAGVQGDTAFVTDALAPAFLVAVAGGGAVVTTVFYNGTNWVAQ